jgi:hypothetical protein
LEEKVFTVDYSKGTQKRKGKKNWSGEKRAKLSTLSFSSLVYPMRKKKGRREFCSSPLFAPSFHHSRRVSLSAAFGWKRESQYGLTSVNGSSPWISSQYPKCRMREGERENRLYRETDESSLKRHSPDSSLFHNSRPIAIVYEFEMSGKCFSLNRHHIFIPTGSTDLLP